ncbi:hypothetical protein BOTBODRAFT_348008 [Botryobasidium botryosum FD-172 SS1]|uniref:Uncharacterized protein n=1 Tax=Botryobasidium botryosum (strain FD-172 SS1) TaxID=930990 RepID=A0A067MHU8_BOTB1|nr:hypothetical protein BOTBODRAFT_348008 [Botryobasidium botryosum FD-172 SS1]
MCTSIPRSEGKSTGWRSFLDFVNTIGRVDGADWTFCRYRSCHHDAITGPHAWLFSPGFPWSCKCDPGFIVCRTCESYLA